MAIANLGNLEMKKVLLGTSALLGVGLLAGTAAASDGVKLSLGGFMRSYYGMTFDDDGDDDLGHDRNLDGVGTDAEVYFLGSVTLSLGVMQLFGVWAAVLLGALMLVAGSALVQKPRPLAAVLLAGVGAVSVAANLADRQRADTAYADYEVEQVLRGGMVTPRAFRVNNQVASLIDSSEPPLYARYVQHLRRILLEDLALSDRDILVLGAGGFTLSHREPANRYTYVDIDPAIRAIAEREFLREPARGEFIATDARRYVADTGQRYDAVAVDVYSSRTSIPGHLVTREFWRDTRRALKPGGAMLANLILDGRLESPYARNLLATIESAYGRCAVEVLYKSAPRSNVIVTCFAGTHPEPTRIYVDERNQADIDSARSP